MSDTLVQSNKVKTELRDFLITNFLFGQDTIQLGEDDSFLDKGIIDSTGILELIGYLEETYKISVEDDELIPENLDSINNVGAFISLKLRGGDGADD